MRDGRRSNTWTAYLKPVRDRVDIRTGCHVHSVIVEDGRAVGVRYRAGRRRPRDPRRPGRPRRRRARIRPPSCCARASVPQATSSRSAFRWCSNSPEVGRNLHDHLLSPVIFTTAAKPVGPPQSGVSVTQTHLFWKSRPELEVPDTQPINFSVPMFGETLEPIAKRRILAHGGDRLAEEPRNAHAERSRSRRSPADRPGRRSPTTRTWHRWSRRCVSAARSAAVRRWPKNGARRRSIPAPTWPSDDLEAYVRRTVATYHHQVSTCRMGRDAQAVVDGRLRVRGIAGLRVIDASVMPRITTGNTNAPAVLIGEQGARFLIEDAGAH